MGYEIRLPSLIFVTALTGCAGLRQFLDDCAEAQPVTPSPFSSVRESQAKGELALGMTRAEAWRVMGAPARTRVEWNDRQARTIDAFPEYPGLPPSIEAVFINGRLTEIVEEK